MGILICPVCAQALTRSNTGYICHNRHNFDRSAEGYVHLLPSNQMHSKIPGDNREMVAARNRFLQAGYYAGLRDAVCELVAASGGEDSEFFDCGCGEGYYTAAVFESAARAGRPLRATGIDISKYALKKAARRNAAIEFAVASAYALPIRTESSDIALNLCSPLCIGELRRVLKPKGTFLYVVPAERHLWQLKELLYDSPYQKESRRIEYDGFSLRDCLRVEYGATIRGKEDIRALYAMTPYAYRTPKDAEERLEQTETLRVDVAFDLYLYRKD